MLSEKDRELIGIGASLGAGCQPCTAFHLQAARMAGAHDGEIKQAITDALCVRRHATEVMAQMAGQPSDYPASQSCDCQTKSLLGELVSISAAYAGNSATDLASHLAAAQKLGIHQGDLLTAIKIAGAVRDTAAAKVEEMARQTVGSASAEPASCCGSSEQDKTTAAEGAAARTGAQTAESPSGTTACGPRCGCFDQAASDTMGGMMRKVMEGMSGCCEPREMVTQMMKDFGPAASNETKTS